MKGIQKTALLVLLPLMLFSCGKDDKLDATFSVTAYRKVKLLVEEVVRGSDGKPIYGEDGKLQTKVVTKEKDIQTFDLMGYYYFVDAFDYEVASYEDALDGRLTVKGTNQTVDMGRIQATMGENGYLHYTNLTSQFVLLVLCETNLKMYATKEVYFELPIKELVTRVRFKPEEKKDYEDGGWFVVSINKDPEDPEGPQEP